RAALIKCLQPFVYRKYFDYGSFESLRDMKTLVAGEVQRRQLQDNLKLGPGGIRQIEFIGQAFQLIRGGRERQFQNRQILVILQRLFEKKYLSKKAKEELTEAYIFLRKAEQFLQIYNDEQ